MRLGSNVAYFDDVVGYSRRALQMRSFIVCCGPTALTIGAPVAHPAAAGTLAQQPFNSTFVYNLGGAVIDAEDTRLHGFNNVIYTSRAYATMSVSVCL